MICYGLIQSHHDGDDLSGGSVTSFIDTGFAFVLAGYIYHDRHFLSVERERGLYKRLRARVVCIKSLNGRRRQFGFERIILAPKYLIFSPFLSGKGWG